MSRARTLHRCQECGAVTPRWAGRCPGCEAWGSLVEEVEPVRAAAGRPASIAAPVALADVDGGAGAPSATGIDELDRVLGGGLVRGSVTLVGGEPGVGKSTLLLQTLASLASRGWKCLLVSAEESAQQVRRRAGRLGAVRPGMWLVAETSMPGIRAAVADLAPDVVVVDSVQTVWDPELGSAPGSVAQVRGCAQALTAMAKADGPAVVLVGHVTKDGTLAGPRVLEHVVDTVLTFDGERHHALRLLRSVKHRFGPTGELGLFEMGDAGLKGVPDPSGLFLGDRRQGTPGSVVFPSMEGYRPLLVELQALVCESTLAAPRRSVSGLDASRLALLVAVLQQRAGINCLPSDVYVSAVGGVRVVEPGADLAVALALASARTGVALPPDLVVLGEIGLGGEIRQVAHSSRRLREAARLGFSTAVVPASAPDEPGVRLRRVGSLAEAVATVLGAGQPAGAAGAGRGSSARDGGATRDVGHRGALRAAAGGPPAAAAAAALLD
ncbi:DNA repair protein RadA [Acidiferrimicrobium sp. IK]|uniref:DNA repair protein RadA n=1 Tax=Acidiferrimicrobium sp. IK TaxID=2871700 RepID=UPI0021CAE75A|nr:DNA repair protein RadA [Acidiferrimicrobium sp. IK]MCU4186971.1 DNA repair protein RadA [Acidiferrimicrobium sp. IK]